MADSPRARRLRTDLRALETLRAESSILTFTATGRPPDHYRIRFYGRGLWRPDVRQGIRIRDEHEVEIKLGASYPRMMPELRWVTPIFHPNISAGGVVCLGGYGTYWVPSLNLDEMCIMLWDMVRYANYDVESPYNRDAAIWARSQTEYRLPVDSRPLRDKVAAAANSSRDQAGPSSSRTSGKPAAGDVLIIGDPALDTETVVDAEIIEPDDPDILFID